MLKGCPRIRFAWFAFTENSMLRNQGWQKAVNTGFNPSILVITGHYWSILVNSIYVGMKGL